MKTLAAILALAATLCASACDINQFAICTAIGCSSGYRLSLLPAEKRFPVGRYDILLEADSTYACSFVLADESTQCESGSCIRQQTCSALYVVSVADSDRVELVYPVIEGPLRVIVEGDGVVLSEAVFEPVYAVSQPNGPGCAPRCFNASDTLKLE